MSVVDLEMDLNIVQRDLDYYLSLSNTYDVRDIRQFRKKVIGEYRKREIEYWRAKQEARIALEQSQKVIEPISEEQETEKGTTDEGLAAFREAFDAVEPESESDDVPEQKVVESSNEGLNAFRDAFNTPDVEETVVESAKTEVSSSDADIEVTGNAIDEAFPEYANNDDSVKETETILKEAPVVTHPPMVYRLSGHGRYVESYKDRSVHHRKGRSEERKRYTSHGRWVDGDSGSSVSSIDFLDSDELENENNNLEVEKKSVELEKISDSKPKINLESKQNKLEVEKKELEVENNSGSVFSSSNREKQKEKNSLEDPEFWGEMNEATKQKQENDDSELEKMFLESEKKHLIQAEAESNPDEEVDQVATAEEIKPEDTTETAVEDETSELDYKEDEPEDIFEIVEESQDSVSSAEESPKEEAKEPVVEKEVQSRVVEQNQPAEPVRVPEDIRDFLREHKGAEIGYVAKYYSKKVIEKNIAMGRIYKRKGKLFI